MQRQTRLEVRTTLAALVVNFKRSFARRTEGFTTRVGLGSRRSVKRNNVPLRYGPVRPLNAVECALWVQSYYRTIR